MLLHRTTFRTGSAAVVGLVLGVALAGGVRPALTAPPAPRTLTADTVRAHHFELTGTDGKVYARLDMQSDGTPRLDLYGAGGELAPRASLKVASDGRAALDLLDAQGRPLLGAQVSADGEARVMLTHGTASSRIDVSMEADGEPRIVLRGPDGATARTYVTRLGQATVGLADKDHKRQINLAASSAPDGSPSLYLTGRDPFTHASFLCWNDRLPTFTLERGNGQKRISFLEDQYGKPRLVFRDGGKMDEGGIR